jgi:hypothetical protein
MDCNDLALGWKKFGSRINVPDGSNRMEPGAFLALDPGWINLDPGSASATPISCLGKQIFIET